MKKPVGGPYITPENAQRVATLCLRFVQQQAKALRALDAKLTAMARRAK